MAIQLQMNLGPETNSIFNEFGNYGSEFSSYSAFNEFASKPPIIINDNYKLIGYLTINELKTPNINTYEAIACARNSFRSFSNSDLEDTEFKDIPSGGGYSGGTSDYSQQNIEDLLRNACPSNSSHTDSGCTCNSGYVANTSGDACITSTQFCQSKYGNNSYGSGTSCSCAQGYEWNGTQTSCVPSVICSLNSTKVGGNCLCNEGYVLKSGQCISFTADCQLIYGENAIGTKGPNNNSSCNCIDGYAWNNLQTACVKKAPILPLAPTPIQPPLPVKEEIKNSPEVFVNETREGNDATSVSVGAQEEAGKNSGSEEQEPPPTGGIFQRIWNWFISLF